MSGQNGAARVVLGPDVILAALYDPPAREVLNQWRDGKITLVLERDLIVAYLRLLRSAGVGPNLLEKWAVRLNHGEDSLVVSGESETMPISRRCESLAKNQDARFISYSAATATPPSEWLKNG